jgi:hypothetical protein
MGVNRALNASPVCPSIAAAATDRAVHIQPDTPTLSRHRRLLTAVGKAEHQNAFGNPRLRERGLGQQLPPQVEKQSLPAV